MNLVLLWIIATFILMHGFPRVMGLYTGLRLYSSTLTLASNFEIVQLGTPQVSNMELVKLETVLWILIDAVKGLSCFYDLRMFIRYLYPGQSKDLIFCKEMQGTNVNVLIGIHLELFSSKVDARALETGLLLVGSAP